MKKIITFLFALLFLISFVSATDVAYVVINPFSVNSDFTSVIDELELTYDVILSSNAATTDFSNYNMILLNNQDFLNSEEIPINEFPALMVNGKNMEDWGWVDPISKVKQSVPLHSTIVDSSHPITEGVSGNDIQIYTSSSPDLFYLGENHIFDGLQVIVSKIDNPNDAVIAIAEAGTTLTKLGNDPTQVNANSVFFGIHESDYWTDDARQLFKNSILWLMSSETSSSFDISLNQGQNLVSFPIDLTDNSVVNLISANPQINSIKKYNGGALVNALAISPYKGYFIDTSSPFTLSVDGLALTGPQDVDLDSGMNLVGTSYFTASDLDNLPANVIEVAKRTTSGKYNIATRYNGEWYNEFALETGNGYWFKLNSGGNIEL
jgi:hypothetical protein